ncbi:hypothetical protein ACFORO_12355 [Amycolatopsis halotolerans]|uniref:Uncharacterized protein n=1 Tax=Amycolatopsis halotolerans TaxID=330083 RepID=A0ABV7QFK9_9PSEU
MSEWAERMLNAANDALGNDTGNVLDCSTAKALAAALAEMAERPDKWWHQEEIDELVAELEQR